MLEKERESGLETWLAIYGSKVSANPWGKNDTDPVKEASKVKSGLWSAKEIILNHENQDSLAYVRSYIKMMTRPGAEWLSGDARLTALSGLTHALTKSQSQESYFKAMFFSCPITILINKLLCFKIFPVIFPGNKQLIKAAVTFPRVCTFWFYVSSKIFSP